MAVIPILMNNTGLLNSYRSLKYFIVQALASVLIIFIIRRSNYAISIITLKNRIVIIALIVKIGVPPVHFWLPQVVENLSSFKIFIIMAWQKINPLIMIIYSSFILTSLFIVITTIIGAIGAVNQNDIKKLIVFSSISNMGWIILSSSLTENLWMIYFRIYVITLISILILVTPLKNKKISTLSLTEIRKSKKNILVFSFLVAAGLPPFVGFFSKVVVLQYLLIEKNLNIILPVLLTGSIVATFYYLKTSFNTFIVKNASNKMYLESPQKKMKINTIILISLSPWLPLIILIS